MNRALLIVNESSGDKIPNRDKVERVQELLTPAGFDLEVVLVSPDNPAEDALQRALKDGVKTVIVGGGDGTVSPIAAQLVKTDVTLGILPLGTFNNIARSINVPPDLDEACGIIARGNTKMIDAGVTEEGRYFFEAAGGGLDAALFPLGEEIKGGRWTRWAQFFALAYKYTPRRIRLTFDCSVADAVSPERRHRYTKRTLQGKSIGLSALIVAIANGPYYGSGFTIAPSARLEDGKFTIVIFRRFSKLELFRHFFSISKGQRAYSPKLETFRAAEVSIGAPELLALHADGEPCGEAPATFKCLPQALKVFAP